MSETRSRDPAPLAEGDLGFVAERLGSVCGFRFGPVQRRSLEMAVRRRMRDLGCHDSAEYRQQVRGSGDEAGELCELLGEFTNTETHFFRHAGRFRLLREQVAADLCSRPLGRSGTIRILSAGCSSGEEVYSTVITLLEMSERWRGRQLEVVGCDINRRALDRARAASYGRWSLRFTPPEILARHFTSVPGDVERFDVREAVRRHARFRWANLNHPDVAASPDMRGFDVVLCCNVLIYFTEDAAARALASLRAMVAEDGYLFLGYTESLHGARGEFETIRAQDYTVYRHKRPAVAAARRGAPVGTTGPAAPLAAPALSLRVAQPADAARREACAESSSPTPRPATALRSVSGPSPAMGEREPSRALAPERHDSETTTADHAYAQARALVDADQQQAAMAVLERLLEQSPFHCGARLLKGYIHGSQRAFLDGAAECTKVLDLDPCLGEAYLLRAMLLDENGDLEDAIGEVKKSLFLEPELALGHYLLAKLRERQGQRTEATRALANAARILRARPDRPLTTSLPFELGRQALLFQIEQRLAADTGPPASEPAMR